MALPILNIDYLTKRPFKLRVAPEVEASVNDYLRDTRQEYWIKKLLGPSLGAAFIADLDGSGVPTDPKFAAIFNELVFDYGTETFIFEGIKRVVARALYDDITMGQAYINTDSGTVTPDTLASTFVGNQESALNWNKVVMGAQILSCFIADNSADYPNYEPQHLELKTIL